MLPEIPMQMLTVGLHMLRYDLMQVFIYTFSIRFLKSFYSMNENA